MSEKDLNLSQVSSKNANERSDPTSKPVWSRKGREKHKKKVKVRKPELNNAPSTSSSIRKPIVTEAAFKETVKGLFCAEIDKKILILQSIKQILSEHENPAFEPVILTIIAPNCLQFLKYEESIDLQLEAFAVLNSITTETGVQARWVGFTADVEPFILLLFSPDSRVVEQSLWALGSISERHLAVREFLITANFVPTFVSLLNTANSPSIIRLAAMTLSILCMHVNSLPQLQEPAQQCFSAAVNLLLTITDEDALGNTVTILHNLTIGTEEKARQIVSSGVVPKLVQLLDSKHPALVFPCLKVMQNITCYVSLIQSVVDAGVFSRLTKLLKSDDRNIVVYTSCVVVNMSGLTILPNEEFVIPGLVPLLIHVLLEAELAARIQAIRVLALVALKQNDDHMRCLFEQQALAAISEMLKCGDETASWTAIYVIWEISKYGKRIGENKFFYHSIKERDGWDWIVRLYILRYPDKPAHPLFGPVPRK